MTASELPPNVREFNEITAVIFARLFNAFPIPSNIPPDKVADELGLADRQQEMPSGWTFNKVFVSTLDWLIAEGFVRPSGPLNIDGVVLTTKGMAAMNAVPPSLSRPLGSELAEATKEASTEEGKTRISQMMGDFWGSFIGSLTKSISGS
jgi:hypothetical protein